jgi:hypothetical protein
MTRNKILLLSGAVILFAASAAAQSEQQAPPPPPPPQEGQPPQANSNGGWRKFGDPQVSQQQPQAAPPYDPQLQQPPPQNYPPPPGYPQGQGYPPQGYYQQAPPMVVAPPQMTLPAGTWVKIHVNQILTTDHNTKGDVFTGTLAQSLILNGIVVAHRGQSVTGHVTDVTKAGRVKGTSQMGLEITELAIADGQQLAVHSDLVEYHGGSTKGNDAVAIGTTMGVGAAIGAAVNGGVGAGVGAAAGLVASGFGVLVTRGRPTVIHPEALLTFKTNAPVTFSTEKTPYAFQPASGQDYAPALQTRRTPYGPYGPYGPRPMYGPVVYRPWGYGYPYYPYPYFGGIYIRGGRW